MALPAVVAAVRRLLPFARPLPGHHNGELAARQGKFEEMYTKVFSTQKEWGESREGKQDVFRRYAGQLGLDLTKFDADLASYEAFKALVDDRLSD
ncbi:DsbA family protein [Streptomyces sp. NPDC101234]|uniref:DsbA family protein n=1 Tax=Streptomyces sp. NPDC101234 TaxID=3366138 RepID=UPI0037F73898